MHGWYGPALGRLVRIQRWKRSCGGWHRRKRIHDHNACDGGGVVRVGDARVCAAWQTERARILFRRSGRAGGDHSGLRIRRSERGSDDRRRGGNRPVFCVHETKILVRL